VDFGLNMASAAILGSVTLHTSNVSVIDHTMSGGPNNLLFGLLTWMTNVHTASHFVKSSFAELDVDMQFFITLYLLFNKLNMET